MLPLLVAIGFHGAGQMPEAKLTRLGGLHRQITTDSSECQAWFDQGLAMLYGFQYSSARRCFEQAAAKDPQCAMAYWGEAISRGPFINDPSVDPESSKSALAALDKAKHAQHCGSLESELIDAQQKRFAPDGPANRSALDAAYADALREVWHRHPDDADVGAMFGEALVDEHPWNQWSKNGQPAPGTLEAIAAFRQVLKANPRHPQALHMLIHSLEASPFPDQADVAADTLFNLQPELAHMQHMPCHIYSRTGQWEKAVQASLVAIDQSRRYTQSRGGKLEGPTLDHYDHMLAYTASMEGRSAVALHALDLTGATPAWLKANGPYYDEVLCLPIKVMQRFGKWDEILAVPDFGPKLPFSEAMRAGARAVAFAATGRQAEAKEEQQNFDHDYEAVPTTSTWDDFDPLRKILDIERHVMNGEILIREQGHGDEAISEIREAVKTEDALHYDEPPQWIQPTRHVLGAALLTLKRFPEAEAVYRADIKKVRPNGWSLYGLSRALEGEGKTREAAQMMKAFRESWKYADIQIDTSCLCLPGKSGKIK